jgi:hypothetical protein
MHTQRTFIVFAFILFGVYPQILNAQCGSNYIYRGIYEGHAYFYSIASLSWEDARDSAILIGGHLVSISSASENNFVANHVVNGELAWIGLYDATNEGSFIWQNNESFGYTNWGTGEPNNAGNENWVEINRDAPGKWNDMPAGYPRRFVVEFETGDTDLDSIPDVCDICPMDANNDADNDGLCANLDNCPDISNVNQSDFDNDGLGDACDMDSDNDGCPDLEDLQPFVSSEDRDCDGISDDCDYCDGGDDLGPCNASIFPGFDQIPIEWICASQKVFVCHQGQTLCLSPGIIQVYLDQGGFLGPCISCDLAQRFQFEMFPNPVSEELTIFINGLEKLGASLVFFDNLGRVVLQKDIDAGLQYATILTNLIDFAPGPYYVRLATTENRVIKKLTVVR